MNASAHSRLPANALDCLERLWLIRRFEEAVERLFHEGRIMGTAHTCIGQEAVAVGVAAALQPQDALTSTHRGHGHFLAHGADPNRVMAELFGRAAGYSGGRGGSQLMMEPAAGFYGANGITAGSMGFAAGLALEAQMRRAGRAVVCLFGDGASNQGVFHETLNLAALWRLPVVFVCENNGYAMSTATCQGLANPNVAARAAAYAMPGATVDGNDLPAVKEAVAAALARARAGAGPTLLECHTYRLNGHSRGDPRVYRGSDEEAAAWQREPVARFEAFLTAQGLADAAAIAARRAAAERSVAEAIHFAETSPFPDPATVAAGVWAE
jgi:pyruvate dehydrogenase E1 component alpha subunit